jgi:hypothetical protein
MLPDITKIQDDDSHWYWIPNDILVDFQTDLASICGKDYMNCPDEFDDFITKYDKYRTGGSPDIIPEFFK